MGEREREKLKIGNVNVNGLWFRVEFAQTRNTNKCLCAREANGKKRRRSIDWPNDNGDNFIFNTKRKSLIDFLLLFDSVPIDCERGDGADDDDDDAKPMNERTNVQTNGVRLGRIVIRFLFSLKALNIMNKSCARIE